MIRDFKKQIVNLKGQGIILKEGDAPERPLLMDEIITNCLLVEDNRLSSDEKYKRFKLAEKIFSDGNTTVNEQDIARIKDCVGSYSTPLYVGQIFDHLDKDFTPTDE